MRIQLKGQLLELFPTFFNIAGWGVFQQFCWTFRESCIDPVEKSDTFGWLVSMSEHKLRIQIKIPDLIDLKKKIDIWLDYLI